MRSIPSGRRLLFLSAIVLPLAALQETASRLLFPLPEVPSFNRLHYSPLAGCIQHEEVRRRGLSNVIIRWQCETDGWMFDHHLSLYGFRGSDFAIEPPKDRARVLFIGDSFVEGVGAGDGQTIPAQFEGLVAGARPVEAINLGVSGADFPEYVRLVRDSVPLLRPEAVFLVIYTNDLPAPPFPPDGGPKAPRFTPRKSFVPRLAQVVRRLARGETVPRFFPTGPFPFFEPVPSPANILSSRPAQANLDPTLLDPMRRGTVNPYLAGLGEHSERALRHDFTTGGGVETHLRFVQQTCQRHGAELTVVYIPVLTVTNPSYIPAQNRLGGPGYRTLERVDGPEHRRHQEHLRSVTAGLEIPFLDMTEPLIEAERSRRMYWAIDTHCTPAGYRLVAERCAEWWMVRSEPVASARE